MIFLHGYNGNVAKKKIRERTMLNVICWGVTAALAVGVAELIGMIWTPYTVVRHLLDMYTIGPMLPATSELYQTWMGYFGTEEALIWTPLSVLAGAFVVGYLAPSRITLLGRAIVAVKTLIGLVLAVSAFSWLLQLISFHFRLPAYMFAWNYMAVQLGCFIGWAVIAGLGGVLGGFLRSLRKSPDSAGTKKLSKTATTP